MSKANLKQQRGTSFPRESFQSIEDYYIQTEEDEASTRPRIKSKIIQFGDNEVLMTPNAQGQIREQSNSKILFKKPKFIARNSEQVNQNQNQINQMDKYTTFFDKNDKPTFEKAAFLDKPVKQKTTKKISYNLSTNLMPSINNANDENIENKLIQDYYSDKTLQQKSFLQLGSKLEVVTNGNVITTEQLKRNQTAKSEIKSNTSIKENIFQKDIKQEAFVDIRTNQVFGQGPRYDQEGNIVHYSIVGKPEWYIQAQEEQRVFRKILLLLCQLFLLEKYQNKIDADSPRQKLNKKISMASFASRTSSLRVKGSIDIGSRQDKKRKTQTKIAGEQMSKEQLVRKIENVEQRIEDNNRNNVKELDKKQYYEKIQEEKQKHQLDQFNKTAQIWDKLNLKISEKILRPPDITLFKSSIPSFRQKVEITSVLEQVKNPNEILGNKFWEATLRDKHVDYMRIKQGQELEEQNNQNDVANILNDNQSTLCRRSQSSHQANRSFYRELSYTKGTRVPVLFKKEVEVIKHPNITNNGSLQNTLQHQTLGQFFGSMNSTIAQTMNQQQPRQLISQQMSRRPFSQQSAQNSSFRAKTPYNYTGFVNANEFMQSIQSNFNSTNHNLNNSYNVKNSHNNSLEKISQFFTALTADPDELFIKGENKLNMEKQALLNDGNPNLYVYKHFNQDEINLIENSKLTTKQKLEEQKLKNESKIFQINQSLKISKYSQFKGEQNGINKQTFKHSDTSNTQINRPLTKQSNFGQTKQLQKISEFSRKDTVQQNRNYSLGQENKLQQQNTLSRNKSELINNQTLQQQKTMKEGQIQQFTPSKQRSPFNQPFQLN